MKTLGICKVFVAVMEGVKRADAMVDGQVGWRSAICRLTCMKLFPRLRAPHRSLPRSSVMDGDMAVTFLGTSSGGGPTRARNCSSLVCDMLNDGSLWSTYCVHIQTANPSLPFSGRLRGRDYQTVPLSALRRSECQGE